MPTAWCRNKPLTTGCFHSSPTLPDFEPQKVRLFFIACAPAQTTAHACI
jgi:hypothetical protein